MELGQDAIMGFARAVAEPREARRSTSDATVTRVEDGVAYVALPGGEGDTPVAQSAASVEVGDAVTVEWRGNALHLTGNMSAPSVGGSYVQQRISPVEAEAQIAAEAAARAGEAADSAAVAAGNAQSSANAAAAAAGSAQASADNANEYAARALGNLSTVQSVTETLAWITQHGTMALTADTEPDPTHVYFVADAGGDYVVGSAHYSLVTEPVAADMATYYELAIDESLNNYVGTHLALTAEGLWLLPASSGAYRILIATGAGTTYTEAGTYIIDANGNSVAKFGTTVRIGHMDGPRMVVDNEGMSVTDEEGAYRAVLHTNVRQVFHVDYHQEKIQSLPLAIPVNLYLGKAKVHMRTGPVLFPQSELIVMPDDVKAEIEAFQSGSYVVNNVADEDVWTYSNGVLTIKDSPYVQGLFANGYNFVHLEYYIMSEPKDVLALGSPSYDQKIGTDIVLVGDGVVADTDNSMAIGKWNEIGEYALAIGNGTDSSHRSNALTVDWNGVVDCGGIAPKWVTIDPSTFFSSMNSGWANDTSYTQLAYSPTLRRVVGRFRIQSTAAHSTGNNAIGTVAAAYRPYVRALCGTTTARTYRMYIDAGGSATVVLDNATTATTTLFYFVADYTMA